MRVRASVELSGRGWTGLGWLARFFTLHSLTVWISTYAIVWLAVRGLFVDPNSTSYTTETSQMDQ